MTSGRVSVFSASRFDSGYMLLPVYVVVGFVSVYSAMLVLSGTCYASVYGIFVYVNMWITDPEVDSRLSGTRVVSAIRRVALVCYGMVDLVSSGKYSGTFVFTAPVAEPTVLSFTVPLNGCTKRCHCNCRDLVLFVGRLPWLCTAGVFALRCRVVVNVSL